MKEIKRERQNVEVYYEYEAIDGTIFSNKEECLKYDNSAGAVLNQKYKELVVGETVEYDIIGLGSDDGVVEIVKVNTPDDIDLIKQVYFFFNQYLQEKEELPSYAKEAFGEIENAYKNNDILFVGRGYNRDSFFIIGTTDSLCAKIKRYYKFLEEKEEK